MRASTFWFAALLALPACEDEPEAVLDGASAVLVPDAAQPAGSDAGASFDAAPPGSDAALAAADAAAITPVDAATSQPVRDAAADSAQLPADAGPQTCPSSARLAPGTTAVEIMVGGQPRSFSVYVPRTYTGATAVPLVVDFHGVHEGALLHELLTSEWDDRVDQEGYVLAMPQGLDNAWNVGPCCTESRAVDDVAFARALVDHLRAAACIDEKRIYASGYSNGGGMSFKLGCDAADLFAAIAPAAFDLLEEMDCKPSRPLSVFIFRGTDDPIVPYAGGASTPPTLYTLPEIHFLGASKTFARWAELDGCTDSPADSGPGCKSYSACRAGVKVTLCTTQGGGHDPIVVDTAWPMLKAFSEP
jgi:polyhydroxybutyrate depolymerase